LISDTILRLQPPAPKAVNLRVVLLIERSEKFPLLLKEGKIFESTYCKSTPKLKVMPLAPSPREEWV